MLLQVAYKVPWTAISSLLGQLSVQFNQPAILLWLNLAYFIPSVPALLLHSSLQERLEQALGLPRAAMARSGRALAAAAAKAAAAAGLQATRVTAAAAAAAAADPGRLVFGLGGLALLSLALPYCCGSIQALLAATAAVGVCYSIAFGTSYQLVTHFPPACTVSLTTGFVSCGVVVLLADLLLKRGPYYSAAGIARLFQVVALQTFIGLAAAAALLRRNWKRLAAAGPLGRYSSSSSSSGLQSGGLGFGRSGSDKQIIGLAVGSVAAGGLSIWPAALGLLLSVGSSMLAFPFFTFVPHSGALAERLPQVLFYARLAGDILGRLMPHRLHLRSSSAVLAAGTAKAVLLALLVPAMLQPQLVGGDAQLALLVAANWWVSGYVNTGAYLLAPRLAAQAAAAGRFQRAGGRAGSKGSGGGGAASVKARAGGIMALAFQASCFVGLLGAWALQSSVLAGRGQPVRAVPFPASWVSSSSSSSNSGKVMEAAATGVMAAAVEPVAAAARGGQRRQLAALGAGEWQVPRQQELMPTQHAALPATMAQG
ncbi:hypothetical protein COO60DRAFT_1636708 [Scenedesmus sp. NREL 46B-D3]|nr:hypothetical protein COO60DRAFT_1636708 [Scenedesmus sp. NREL 46B-D3]